MSNWISRAAQECKDICDMMGNGADASMFEEVITRLAAERSHAADILRGYPKDLGQWRGEKTKSKSAKKSTKKKTAKKKATKKAKTKR